MGNTATTAIGAPTKESHRDRVQYRAILRAAFVAAIWAGLFCWIALVLPGSVAPEASHTVFWLLRILCFYLGALAFWVVYNKVLFGIRGPSKLYAGETRTFDKDYFGRPVRVAEEADLTHQHLVLAYEDGHKVYRAPTPDEVQPVEEPAQEPAVTAGVKALAAAAGAGAGAGASQSSSASEQEAPSETHAGDL